MPDAATAELTTLFTVVDREVPGAVPTLSEDILGVLRHRSSRVSDLAIRTKKARKEHRRQKIWT